MRRGPALVRGLGGRHLPEPQPDPRREARLRLRLRRRPHLPHGPAADGRPAHRRRRRRSTVAGDPRAAASRRDQFGVIETAADGRTIAAFREKPTRRRGPRRRARTRSSRPWATTCSAPRRSSTPCTEDAATTRHATTWAATSSPCSSARGEAQVYDFSRNEVPGATDRDRGYWRDVGTLDAYYDAHMDLHLGRTRSSTSTTATGRSSRWPDPLPPAKFVFDDEDRMGHALDSMVVRRASSSPAAPCGAPSLSPGVRVHSGAEVEDSIVMHDVGHRPRRRRAPRDHRQERANRGRCAHRRGPRGRPQALHRLRRRHRRDPQGQTVAA